MPWFRWRKREEQAPSEAAAPEAPEQEEKAPQGPADDTERKPARRRRGSRGGRGRKKKVETPAAEATPAAAAKKGPERKRQAEQPRQRRKRAPAKRATATPRAARPDVKKEILISVDVSEQTVAVLEDGKPAEVYLGRPERWTVAGNIYKGVVDNVLPGMEASFVDIGLEKNGFLYVDEIVVPELEGKRHGKKIQELISRGEELLVQAVKDPMGTKGARLTTEISLPGRFVVYTPYGDGIGVSRRLDDAERERLKKICKGLELPEGGLIVRTAAEGASEEELTGDLKLLLKLWGTIRSRASRTRAPALVYQEADLPLRIVRDLFIRDFERVLVDHERTYRKIVGYLKRTSPELAARVERYTGKEPLLEKSGVEEAVRSTLGRRVDLPSGGYLIFDYAEAFTVIDVNTGRFVGGRGKSSQGRLEDTITKNNLEAVTEVVRQLRLRDIGGIIVIDFIDMANPKNRQLVEQALNEELERDRTKTYVVEISPLGLVEMTRQNVTDGPREILTVSCPTCAGDGVIVSAETHAVDAERKLRRRIAGSKAEAFLVEMHSDVARLLSGPDGSRLLELERETGRRFAFKTKKSFRLDRFEILAEGKVGDIEGLEPKEAAPTRRPARARKGQALVALEDEVLDEALEEAPEPGEPSAEADAPAEEKPKKKTRRGTRGGRGRKRKTTAAAASDGAGDGAGATPPVPAEKAEAAVEAAGEGEAEGEGGQSANGDVPAEEKPKRKTRRGTRGGRRRRKKPAVEGEAAAETPAEPIAGAEEPG
ncbi:MAG TPA: Rne/Rng family ribonuclease [Gaiellaceae bacterium]|nr:Rne/Rng family ribonuclease [Gaiellaceae bacterium]